MGKVKAKHEKECAEYDGNKLKLQNVIKQLSNELYVLNDKQLDLQKDNEFMKTRLRMLENNPHQNHGRPSLPMTTKLMGRIPGMRHKPETDLRCRNNRIISQIHSELTIQHILTQCRWQFQNGRRRGRTIQQHLFG